VRNSSLSIDFSQPEKDWLLYLFNTLEEMISRDESVKEAWKMIEYFMIFEP
jgi:DNA-binding winged helix-turn-helix (wHTH) protein